MLEYGRSRIDLDWRMYAGQSIRSQLHHKFPKLPMPPRKIENRLSEDKNIRLLAYLQVKDTESFKLLLKNECIDLNYFYSDPYYCTILELACRIPGYEDFVQLILQAGGDPNTKNKIDGNPLIHQAAECANDNVLKMLLAIESVDICVLNKTYSETALHLATQSISPEEKEIKAMENTINLLLDYKHFSDGFSDTETSNIDINAEDEGGDTALHNATYFGLDSISLLLLHRGASMTKENSLGYAPIAYLSQGVLQTHLDSQVDSNGMSPQNDYFELIFRYDTLVSTPNYNDNLAEMKAMKYLVDSEDLRPILRHPLVQTFLYLKWHNVKNLFMYNLLLYLLFVISLTTYSVSLNVDITEKEENVTCLVIIGEQEKPAKIYQSLNTSPIITLNETLLQSMPVFPMNTSHMNTTSCEYQFTDIHRVMRIIITSLRTLLLLFLLLLLIREGSQLVILRRKYFISVENLMEILLILGTTIIILSPYLDELVVRHICGVVILLAWTELILLSGRLPALSIQLEMFKKVCVTFVRFMAWYSLIILAFAFSFFVLLRGNDKFFLNPGISIVKTVIMLAGEFEASDLEFTNAPGTSHVIFLLFVCLIAIVLLNLLNGLAVYDTQAIKDDATVLGLVSMVRLVNYIEEFLLKLLIFSKLCKLVRFENYLKKKIQLFDPKIHKKQIHIFPQGGEIRFLLDAETTKRFDEYRISRIITDAAIDIVIKKNQDTEFQKMKDAFTHFSKKIVSIEESLKILISNGKL